MRRSRLGRVSEGGEEQGQESHRPPASSCPDLILDPDLNPLRTSTPPPAVPPPAREPTPMSTPPSPDATAAPTQLGNYDIVSKIADGGMGTVYKGRHRRTGEVVAVKVIA